MGSDMGHIYIYMLSVYILTYAPPSPPLPTFDTATAVEGYMPVARLGTHSVHHLHTDYVCNKHCYYYYHKRLFRGLALMI
jgi:hypothetical protein